MSQERKSTTVLWAAGSVLSLVGLVLTAGMRAQALGAAWAHMAIGAVSAVLLAALAVRDCRDMLERGAPASAVAASNAFYMGLVWTWGGLALAATYATGVLVWSEWWHFVIGFAAAAALSFYFSAALDKAAGQGPGDEALLRRARYAAIAQLAGMVIAMLGLLIDGKMTRFFVLRYTDWAANNVFFFGALAIALISGYALRANRHA